MYLDGEIDKVRVNQHVKRRPEGRVEVEEERARQLRAAEPQAKASAFGRMAAEVQAETASLLHTGCSAARKCPRGSPRSRGPLVARQGGNTQWVAPEEQECSRGLRSHGGGGNSGRWLRRVGCRAHMFRWTCSALFFSFLVFSISLLVLRTSTAGQGGQTSLIWQSHRVLERSGAPGCPVLSLPHITRVSPSIFHARAPTRSPPRWRLPSCWWWGLTSRGHRSGSSIASSSQTSWSSWPCPWLPRLWVVVLTRPTALQLLLRGWWRVGRMLGLWRSARGSGSATLSAGVGPDTPNELPVARSPTPDRSWAGNRPYSRLWTRRFIQVFSPFY